MDISIYIEFENSRKKAKIIQFFRQYFRLIFSREIFHPKIEQNLETETETEIMKTKTENRTMIRYCSLVFHQYLSQSLNHMRRN